ncbi:MAG: hypothetical protein HYZ48_04945 [Chlamydiales bacterium]|nr:hypothetical protein [Chlamydiales bacterium]
MTQAPLSWLQRIESSLEDLKEVPLWGSPPPFPWKECSEELATAFELTELKIEHMATSILKADQFFSGLGAQPVRMAVDLAPLQGSLFWVMSAEDVAAFTRLILTPEGSNQ